MKGLIFEGKFLDWHENCKVPFVALEYIYGDIGNIQDMGRMYLEDYGAKTDRFPKKIDWYIEDKFMTKKGDLLITKGDRKDMMDLTKLFTFSIDKENSRALDDAISIEKIEGKFNKEGK